MCSWSGSNDLCCSKTDMMTDVHISFKDLIAAQKTNMKDVSILI